MITTALPDMFALLDERTGPVVSLVDIDVPGAGWASQSEVCETGGFGLSSGAPAAAGCSSVSRFAAQVPAMAEAVERYCGHLIDHQRLEWSTWRDLHHSGVDAIDPHVFALYRSSQTLTPGFPFAGLGPDDVVAWVAATDFDGVAVRIPAALVWLAPGPQSVGAGGRHITMPVTAGIAAGVRQSDAVAHGLREVVERHALAHAWHRGGTFPRLSGVPTGENFTAYGVPNRWNLPIVLAAYSHDGLLSFGCSHTNCWQTATTKACSEAALMARTTLLIESGELDWHRPQGPMAARRDDRAYVRSYADDFSDVTDVSCHAQLLLDPTMQSIVRSRLGSSDDATSPTDLSTTFSAPGAAHLVASPEPGDAHDVGSHAALSHRLRADNLRPVFVDLTTSDVSQCGLHVVRVVVPGLRATAPAAFPLLGDGFEPLPRSPFRVPVPHV